MNYINAAESCHLYPLSFVAVIWFVTQGLYLQKKDIASFLKKMCPLSVNQLSFSWEVREFLYSCKIN